MSTRKRSWIVFAFLTCLCAGLRGVAGAATVYVDADATGNNNGTSWVNAYNRLEDGLADATSGEEVWVAEGTYRPDGGTGDRSRSFVLKSGVTLLGGFSGTETGKAERDWGHYQAILSGDIGAAGNALDNSYHVVLAQGGRLDGLVIEGGNADGTGSEVATNYGGGVFLSGQAIISNCWIRHNKAGWGGGIASYGVYSSIYGWPVSVVNCTFESNESSAHGSALLLKEAGGDSTVTNCSFFLNVGPSVLSFYKPIGKPKLKLSNCTFGNNNLPTHGMHGVIYVEGSCCDQGLNVEVDNSIFYGNPLPNAYLLQNDPDGDYPHDPEDLPDDKIVLFFSIWGSVLEGGASSIHEEGVYPRKISVTVDPDIITSNPLFRSATDLRLKAGSPAVDSGDNSTIPADIADLDGDGNVAEQVPSDLDGRPRIKDDPDTLPATATVDMGAYERDRIIYVDASAVGANTGGSWGDAFTSLQDALAAAAATSTPDEIWVAQGTYYPDRGVGYTVGDRNASFLLRGQVEIYGGFLGRETARSQRDWRKHETTLSGNLGIWSIWDNSYHVVQAMTAYGANSTSRLDGFTIAEGRADGGAGQDSGGGLVTNTSPMIVNCTFRRNSAAFSGGAVYADAGGSGPQTPRFVNCTFLDNAAWIGGAMYNTSLSPELVNCLFMGNSANTNGGAIYNGHATKITLRNCTLTGNQADSYGGAINNVAEAGESEPLLHVYNTILWGNTAPNGSQIALANADLIIYLSDVEGGQAAIKSEGSSSVTYDVKNQTADPLFIAGTAMPTWKPRSPVIDAGGNGYLPNDMADLDGDGNTAEILSRDLSGRSRVVNTYVDQGAYEIAEPRRYYVKSTASGGSGLSWATALRHLQDALAKTLPGDEVWVAQGTYRPDRSGDYPGGTRDRNASFQLQSGVALYGGFGGTETDLNQQDWEAHPTILSGDLAGNDGAGFANTGENAYHVVDGSGTAASARLDGFVVTGGNADAGYHPENKGGGVFTLDGSPTVANCTLTANSARERGGGMWNGGGGPLVSNSVFSGNRAVDGGGLANETSSPTVSECIFTGNTATGSGSGGGYYERVGSASTIVNCLFAGNSASGGGGYYSTENCNSICTNCTFAGNTVGTAGGGLYVFTSSALTVTNGVIWGNTAGTGRSAALSSTSTLTISYSGIQGGTAGIYRPAGSNLVWRAGNIMADPLFVGGGDYHLTASSPCIEAGSNDATSLPAIDIDGEPRTIDADGNGVATTDMGFDEFLEPTVTVVAAEDAAAEAGPMSGIYRITRFGTTGSPLTVFFTLGGTAINGTDYQNIPLSRTIPAGYDSVDVNLTPIDDTEVEADETAVLVLSAHPAYTVGTPGSATVTIESDDLPAGEIILDNAPEGQSGGGSSYTGTWLKSYASGAYGPDSLYSNAANSTYRWTPTIPAAGTYKVFVRWTAYSTRSTSVPIAVTHAGGTATKSYNQRSGGGVWVLHGTYSFNAGTGGYVQVQGGLSASGQQACADAVRFVAAASLPTVTIAATDPTAAENPLDTGVFTVSRTGSTAAALPVSYTVGGTATSGSDYAALSGGVTIPIGSLTATVTVTPVNDTQVEGNETVAANLTDNAAYVIGTPGSATVTIASDDLSSGEIILDNLPEGSSPQGGISFTGTWKKSTLATTAPYGADSLYNYETSTPVPHTYRWTPNIPATGRYEVWVHWTKASTRSTIVPYTVRYVDEATNTYTTTPDIIRDQRNYGGDWADPSLKDKWLLGTYKFLAGTGGYVEVSDKNGQACADAVKFVPEVSALPTVTVTASDPNAAENPLDAGSFTVARTGSTATALTVSYNVAGSATANSDYTALSGTVNIAAGSTTAPIPVTPINDTAVEANETVKVTLSANPAYTVGTPDNATVTIASDDGVILIDNLPAGVQSPGGIPVSYTGTWKKSTLYTTAPCGADSLYSDAANSTYRWTPNIQVEGRYEVWVHWTRYTNRSTSVPYTVRYVDEATNSYTTVVLTKDQRNTGANWPEMVLLGTYKFLPGTGGYVEVRGGSYTATPSQQASADAVKFVQVP